MRQLESDGDVERTFWQAPVERSVSDGTIHGVGWTASQARTIMAADTGVVQRVPIQAIVSARTLRLLLLLLWLSLGELGAHFLVHCGRCTAVEGLALYLTMARRARRFTIDEAAARSWVVWIQKEVG
jgi:hypothetical protein